MLRARDFTHSALVGRVDEGEEQAHRNALGTFRDQAIECGPHRPLVERLDHLTVGPDPFAHHAAHGARGQKHRSLRVETDLVHLVTHLAPDFQGISESLGRNDAQTAALAFEHRVGSHRGAVRKLGDGAGFKALSVRQPFDGGDGRIAGVLGSARNLEHDGRLTFSHAHDIRERPSDIHTNSVASLRHVRNRLFSM